MSSCCKPIVFHPAGSLLFHLYLAPISDGSLETVGTQCSKIRVAGSRTSGVAHRVGDVMLHRSLGWGALHLDNLALLACESFGVSRSGNQGVEARKLEAGRKGGRPVNLILFRDT